MERKQIDDTVKTLRSFYEKSHAAMFSNNSWSDEEIRKIYDINLKVLTLAKRLERDAPMLSKGR